MVTFKKIDPVNMAETVDLDRVINISSTTTEKKMIVFIPIL